MGFRLQFMTMRRESSGGLKLADLQAKMSMIKHIRENLSEQERSSFLQDSYQNLGDEVDFELFLRVNPQTKTLIICIYLLHVCVFRAWIFFIFFLFLYFFDEVDGKCLENVHGNEHSQIYLILFVLLNFKRTNLLAQNQVLNCKMFTS